MNQSKQQYFSRDTDCLSSSSRSGFFSDSLRAKENKLSKIDMIQKIRQLQLILKKQHQRNKQELWINETLKKKFKKKNQIFVHTIQYSSLHDNKFQQNIMVKEKDKRQRHIRHQSNLADFDGNSNISQKYFKVQQKNPRVENNSKITQLNRHILKNETLQYRMGIINSKKLLFQNNRQTIRPYQQNGTQLNSLRKRKRYKSIDQIWDETR